VFDSCPADIHAASGGESVVVILDLYYVKESVGFAVTLRYFADCARQLGSLVLAHREILTFAPVSGQVRSLQSLPLYLFSRVGEHT
jgi:hypothetical protein